MKHNFIRYAFNSQEGYESAKKALDSNKIAYSDGSDPGTIMVQTDDCEHIDRIIGRQMAMDGVKGKFTNSSSHFAFDVPRDFGPNDELIANLEGLKQELKDNPSKSHEAFLHYLDSLPEHQVVDLMITICGNIFVNRLWDYEYVIECVSKESVYPDPAYETMKTFVKECFVLRNVERIRESTACSVTVDFPHIDGLVDALDAIIEKRKSNI